MRASARKAAGPTATAPMECRADYCQEHQDDGIREGHADTNLWHSVMDRDIDELDLDTGERDNSPPMIERLHDHLVKYRRAVAEAEASAAADKPHRPTADVESAVRAPVARCNASTQIYPISRPIQRRRHQTQLDDGSPSGYMTHRSFSYRGNSRNLKIGLAMAKSGTAPPSQAGKPPHRIGFSADSGHNRRAARGYMAGKNNGDFKSPLGNNRGQARDYVAATAMPMHGPVPK